MERSKFYLVCTICLIVVFGCSRNPDNSSTSVTNEIMLTKEELRDKIMGGWAGQTIGVTFGGPYEFDFNGTWIQDYQPLEWHEDYLKETMTNTPGLYDDIYMDLTFVDVFEREGFDAPVDSFANAFATADYKLWHANQAARYNILNGVKAPESGHWMNNPHAQDIDYQIEADYAGLMSPGMPNAASEISDKIGHIMNYGDGWYGGVYVGAMYTLAFVSDDVNHIVEEALKTIPARSEFYKTISDVIKWHRQYPDDWVQTWFEVQKKYAADRACPIGVYRAFNIDAKINSAYVVMGLLYGKGDFTKSMEIATRAGQDADCNPATVAGILGAMKGYNNIPDYWKMGLDEVEDIDFKYTTMSLNDVYEIGFQHALQNIERNGGSVDGEQVTIPVQQPEAVRFEQGFPEMEPVRKIRLSRRNVESAEFSFTGNGFVLRGEALKKDNNALDYVFEVELYVDGEKVETAKLPTSFTKRRVELFWEYQLTESDHDVRIKVLNPHEDYELRTVDVIVYSNRI